MEKFTKGKWIATDSSRDGGKSLVCTINTKNCVVSEFDTSTDARFDAALIAAAPEMYAKLNEISDGLLEAGGFGNCALAKEIESLLSKARGE